MALPRPGEHHPLAAALAVLVLCALACAETRTRRLPATVVHAARIEASSVARSPGRRGNESAALVERALHDAGLRFGTDGSVRALWGYLRTSHRLVPAEAAQPGDIVFFDTRGGNDEPPACADHAGIVESIDDEGRIGFLEVRGGQARHSFVQPILPTVRRGSHGEILNTFLRTKQVGDPPGTRYFAGQMLCAVARVDRR